MGKQRETNREGKREINRETDRKGKRKIDR